MAPWLAGAGANAESNSLAPLCPSALSFLMPTQEVQQQKPKSSNHCCFPNLVHGRVAVFPLGTGLPERAVEEHFPVEVSLPVADTSHH